MKRTNNPFDDSYASEIPDTVMAAESFIDLTSNDSTLKSDFKEKRSAIFWLNVREEYPALSARALKFFDTICIDLSVRRYFPPP